MVLEHKSLGNYLCTSRMTYANHKGSLQRHLFTTYGYMIASHCLSKVLKIIQNNIVPYTLANKSTREYVKIEKIYQKNLKRILIMLLNWKLRHTTQTIWNILLYFFAPRISRIEQMFMKNSTKILAYTRVCTVNYVLFGSKKMVLMSRTRMVHFTIMSTTVILGSML